jgi:hypothetical protein
MPYNYRLFKKKHNQEYIKKRRHFAHKKTYYKASGAAPSPFRDFLS